MPRVDYDQIAHLYDEPIRDHAVDKHLLTFLEQRPDLTPDRVRVLDVGCGTGKQLTANRAQLPAATLLGVDRYRGMLRIARRREPGVTWVHGDGARLPIQSESFDFATNQFSYHHIANRDGFFHEVFRVLRPGGRFVLSNIDPWSMSGWAIYRFFPEAQHQDEQDCWPGEKIVDMLREIGFADVRIERHMLHPVERLADALAYVSDRHRTSQLMVISDPAYAAGVARVRAALAESGEDASVQSAICLMVVTADRPGRS